MAFKVILFSYDRELGRVFDELRAERHITKLDLAAMLGTSRASIHRKLRGDTPFTIAEGVTLARVLDTTLQEILMLIDTEPHHDQPVRS